MTARAPSLLLAALLVRIGLLVLYFSFSWILEKLIPATTLKRRGVWFNCAHGLVYTLLAVGFADQSMMRLGAHIGLKLFGTARVGLIPIHLSDHGRFLYSVPLSLLNLALYDFFYYWLHRLQHTSPWLWAQHELHHSEEQMNVTTGVRHHHLELILTPLFVTIPLALIFDLPKPTWALATILTQAFVYFIHANARIGFGWFNRCMANPQVHRIHHSRLPQHFDKNFAAYFPLWDVIFGTYYHPAKDEYPPVGLASGRIVNSVWEAAVMPFATWRQMLSRRSLHQPVAANSAARDVS